MNRLSQLVLTSITTAVLAACGASETKEPEVEQPPVETVNTAPTHNGSIIHNKAESDDDLVVDLLAGASDADGDQLSITDLQASANNPDKGFTITGNTVTITPSAFIDELADDESVIIRYDYKISDGTDTVDRVFSVTIMGETAVVEPDPSEPNEDAINVYVDLSSHQYFATSGVLQRNKFFNIHTSFWHNENPRAHIEKYVNDWNASHGRGFWSSISIAKQKLGEAKYPTTEYAKTEGPKEIAQYYSHPLKDMLDNRRVDTDRGRNFVVPGADPVEGARWNADYYEFYFDDNSRPLFYEPMNEPFVHATDDIFKRVSDDGDQIRSLMTEWFKELGKAMDERPALKDMHMLGFGSAWPSLELWDFGHWDSRMKMYMDVAGEYTDAFSIHLYNGINIVGQETQRTGSNAQAILDLIETYSHYKWDKVKPHAITEYGNIIKREAGDTQYSPWANSIRLRSMNQLLIEQMNREERILTSIPFLTGLASWYWQDVNAGDGGPYNASLWRPDLDKIELVDGRWKFIDPNDPNNYVPNANQLFYEMWKDVEGRRIAANSQDPDLQHVAYSQGNKSYVILNSLEDNQNTSVKLNIAELADVNYQSVRIERMSFNDEIGAVYTDETVNITETVGSDADFTNLTIKPGETVKLTITTSKTVEVANTYQRSLYYSDDHLLSINANQAMTFNINNVDVGTSAETEQNVMLRMSMSRLPSQNKIPTLTFNGTEVSVPNDWAGYDQDNRDDFFGAIEIPIPRPLLSENNVIKATYSDNGGRISSMVLHVNNKIESISVDSVSVSEDVELTVGDSTQATSTVLPANASDLSVTWSSSNESIATVDQSGAITAVNAGTATITATSVNAVSDSLIVTVTERPANLLFELNANFETGVFSPWESYWNSPANSQYQVTSEAAKDGAFGLHVTFDGTSDGALNEGQDAHTGITLNKEMLPQTMGENQGRQFKLSFDAKANDAASVGQSIKLLLVAQQHWSYRLETTLTPFVDQEWQKVEYTFDELDWSVPQAAGHDYRMELFFASGQGSGDFYIDNVSIDVVE